MGLMSLSYGMETCHPIHNVHFYKQSDLTKSYTADLEQITFMQDEARFREVIFRVFIKNKLWADECKKAVKVFCVEKGIIIEEETKDDGVSPTKISCGMSPKIIKSPPRNNNAKRQNEFGAKPNPDLMDIFNEE